MQVDNFNELPEEKRPPDSILWWGTLEEIEKWIDVAISGKKENNGKFFISYDEVE